MTLYNFNLWHKCLSHYFDILSHNYNLICYNLEFLCHSYVSRMGFSTALPTRPGRAAWVVPPSPVSQAQRCSSFADVLKPPRSVCCTVVGAQSGSGGVICVIQVFPSQEACYKAGMVQWVGDTWMVISSNILLWRFSNSVRNWKHLTSNPKLIT